MASTGQGLLGHNMFAYCNNNPVIFRDGTGTYVTYSGVTYDGVEFKNVPAHQLGWYGQIADYWLDEPTFGNKLWESAVTILESVYVEGGVGFGLGIEYEVSEYVGIEGLIKSDCLHFKLSQDCNDIGMDLYASGGLTIFGKEIFEAHEIHSYSAVTNEYTYFVDPPNYFELMSFSGYLIIGGNISVGWDVDRIVIKLKEIWR